VANWEVLAVCEVYQTKGFDIKGKCIMDFLKDFFITDFFKKDAIFGHSE